MALDERVVPAEVVAQHRRHARQHLAHEPRHGRNRQRVGHPHVHKPRLVRERVGDVDAPARAAAAAAATAAALAFVPFAPTSSATSVRTKGAQLSRGGSAPPRASDGSSARPSSIARASSSDTVRTSCADA